MYAVGGSMQHCSQCSVFSSFPPILYSIIPSKCHDLRTRVKLDPAKAEVLFSGCGWVVFCQLNEADLRLRKTEQDPCLKHWGVAACQCVDNTELR